MKHIEKGINPPSLDEIYFSGNYLLKGIRIGIVAGMVALTVSKKVIFCSSTYMSSSVDVKILFN